MRVVSAWSLCIVGIGFFVAVLVQKADYAKGAANRIRKAYEHEHVSAQVELDELDVKNEELQREIDRREHRRNSGAKLSVAMSRLSADRLLADLDQMTYVKPAPEDTTNELLEALLGTVTLVGGILLFIRSGKQSSHTTI